MIFQASGWVEPDPYPVKATALIDGVVETVEVLEGQIVESGQLLATLIADDARLDLDTAESKLTSWQAQAAGHEQQIAVVEAEMKSLARQVAAAAARRDEAAGSPASSARLISSGTLSRRKSRSRIPTTGSVQTCSAAPSFWRRRKKRPPKHQNKLLA
mgnify:FL=1